MALSRNIFYLITLLLFFGLTLIIPEKLDFFSLIEQQNFNTMVVIFILFSAYISLVTIFAVTDVAFSELTILVLLSFIIATFTIGLPNSLSVLFILIYCYKVRKNTQLLRKPDPSFSTMTNLPSLFFLVGVFVAALLWLTATPDFKPENFASMDQFAEVSTGCPADQIMEDCIEDIVESQTQYTKMIGECNTLPAEQRTSCVYQLQQQYSQLLEQTKAKYEQKIPLDVTVSEFYRYLAAEQVNELAEKNPDTFRIIFAVAAFSIVSGIGGLVNLVVAPLTSIFLGVFLSFGVIRENYSTEEVLTYYLE